MRDRDRYLKLRGNRFHYVRRVPGYASELDTRGTVRVSLKTDNIATARKKRDQLEEADNLYWSSVLQGNKEVAFKRYQAAVERATLNGFVYMPVEELAAQATLSDLVKRFDAVSNTGDTAQVEALLGGVERPKVSIREAFDIYINEICASEILDKSPSQRASWRKVKLRAVNNFIKTVGDIPLGDITRDHARTFYKWWLDRIVSRDEAETETLSPSSGNRDVGNMRKLYAEYFQHIGEEDRLNPFRGLSFSSAQHSERASFSTEWIVSRILKPSALDSLNIEARMIVYILIETGCRPSEICNLDTAQIKLNDPVPHISIRPVPGREIKTKSSRREIPLVGVALEAMKQAPNGFPRYKDNETNLSATLSKNFKAKSLFPTEHHYIYSFRHSFEKRMTEAGIDYGLRCLLMGHSTNRPAYGDGGSMEYRRDELNKIVLPFDEKLFYGV